MEFKLSENKLKELAGKFEQDLIQLVAPHSKTGKLEDSIKVSFSVEGDGYKINIEALEYIKYLEKGELIKKFKEEKIKELAKELKKTMAKDVKQSIMDSLKQLKK